MTVVRVIGCGNPDAGDDGAGIVAVERARRALESIPGVEVLPSVSPVDVVHHLDGSDGVVVADAIRTPGGTRRPGTVVRAVAGPEGLPAEIRSSLSSHGLGVAEAVGLAAAIGPVPRVVVLGIEAETSAAGAGRSPAVERGLPLLTSMIVEEARAQSDALGGNDPPEAERSPGPGSTGPIRGRRPQRR